jgi:endonuclease/exonuclease/phosphatase family metal-dependent hydrolase
MNLNHKIVMFRIATFNILAPIWDDIQYYPGISEELLHINNRRKVLKRMLDYLACSCDIIGLQEITYSSNYEKSEYEWIVKRYSEYFYIGSSKHERFHWNYCKKYCSYMDNGNVLLIRKTLFTQPKWFTIKIHSNGNVVLGCRSYSTRLSKNMTILVVHLEDENKDIRMQQLRTLLQIPADIILGDFNCDLETIQYKKLIMQYRYINTLKYVSDRVDENIYQTTQILDYEMIDHILCSKKFIPSLNEQQYVLDFDLIELDDQFDRLTYGLSLCGSDHYPVTVTLYDIQ